MKEKIQGIFFAILPIISMLVSQSFAMKLNIVWLLPIMMVLIFLSVAVLPFCRKRESLWLFVLGSLCLGPVNFFLFKEYSIWEEFLYIGKRNGVAFYMALIEITLAAVCVETIILTVIGRVFWKKQYAIYIP